MSQNSRALSDSSSLGSFPSKSSGEISSFPILISRAATICLASGDFSGNTENDVGLLATEILPSLPISSEIMLFAASVATSSEISITSHIWRMSTVA